AGGAGREREIVGGGQGAAGHVLATGGGERQADDALRLGVPGDGDGSAVGFLKEDEVGGGREVQPGAEALHVGEPAGDVGVGGEGGLGRAVVADEREAALAGVGGGLVVETEIRGVLHADRREQGERAHGVARLGE